MEIKILQTSRTVVLFYLAKISEDQQIKFKASISKKAGEVCIIAARCHPNHLMWISDSNKFQEHAQCTFNEAVV